MGPTDGTAVLTRLATCRRMLRVEATEAKTRGRQLQAQECQESTTSTGSEEEASPRLRALPTPCFWPPSLWNCERMNVCRYWLPGLWDWFMRNTHLQPLDPALHTWATRCPPHDLDASSTATLPLGQEPPGEVFPGPPTHPPLPLSDSISPGP